MELAEKNIKLIALDMDGTLLNEELDISQKNQQTITKAQESGIHVVLSTGRTIMTCKGYADSLDLSSYLVTANGSEIWHTTGELIDRVLLTNEQMELMYDLSKKYETHFWAASTKHVYRNDIPENLTSHQWLKFGFDVKEDNIREKINAILASNNDFEITNSSLTNIEVNVAGVNKANALKKVCRELDITMDHVLAMGDSLNDIAMIKEAGIGVAMANAQDIVKETADWITTTNVNNGVAAAIEKFVFHKAS